jgi:REP element-mobilizing transposase RayT
VNYNPNVHHRKSIRLKGYDYSQAGLYFITICVQDRLCLFGEIVDGKMILNNAGKIADECWLKIPKHFPNPVLHEHIVMPNHIHGIIELQRNDSVVGTRHVVSLPDNTENPLWKSHVMSVSQNQFSHPIPGSVSVIVQQYKSSVKRFCNKNNFSHFLLQSRFYEHIIRNEQSYEHIADYIINNPKNWKEDNFFND